MSRLLPVNYNGAFSYNIFITDAFAELANHVKEIGYAQDKKFCIVTDSNVAPLYAEMVKSELEKVFPNVYIYTFPAGEEHKMCLLSMASMNS